MTPPHTAEPTARATAVPIGWESTPLGASHGWPAELAVLARLVADAAQPMALAWGPQLVVLYNDAWSRCLGPGQHPRLLGRPFTETWAGLGPGCEPLLAQVLAGATARHDAPPLCRDGPCSCTLQPARDAQGRVQGVLLQLLPATLPEPLRSRWAIHQALVQSMDEGYCVMRVLRADDGEPRDWIFVDTNPAFAQHAGLAQDVVGRRASEALQRLEPRWLAIVGRVAAGGRPERFVEHSDALGRWFDAYAFPIPGCPDLVGLVLTDISGERRLLEAERRARARLESVFATMGDALVLLGRDWRITGANPAAERLLGYARSELVERDFWQAWPRLQGSGAQPELQAAMGGGLPRLIELHDAQAGQWLELRAFPSPDGLALYARDITDRRQREVALQVSQARLQAILDHTPAAVFLKDRDGRYVYANPAALQVLDMPPQQVIGRSDDQLFPPALVEAIRRTDRSAWDGYSPVQYRDRMATGQGERWFIANKFVLRGVAGDSPDLLCGISVDISAEQQAREQLEHQARELRIAQDRLAIALEAGRMGVWDWDVASGRAHWNPGMYELLDLPPGHGVADIGALRERVHPDDRPLWEAANARALAQGDEFHLEFRLLLPGGRVRWLVGRGRAVGDGGGAGTPQRMLGVNYDVTAWREAEQRLQEMDRRRNEFLAMLAHELRNPLAPLTNAVTVLERTLEDLARHKPMLAIARRQIAQLSRLVDDLLEVSRVTQGRIELRKEPLQAGQAVLPAVETVREAAREQGQQLSFDVPPGLELEADPARLVQVLANLLNNAVKYTPAGGHIRLRAYADAAARMAVFEVADDGLGIDADLLPRVFDLFSQGTTTLDRARGGLGIGLSLVKRLVELHDGTVQAASPGPGRGSTFTVRLPLSERRAPQRALPAGPPQAALPPTDVLLVDDNVDAAQTLALLLRADGHAVRLAHEGESALAQARAQPPALLLLDIGLPGLDGYEVARRLRAEPATRDVAIVAVSGYGQAADRARGRAAGFDAHLTKPVDLQTVYAAARRVLAQRRGPDAAGSDRGLSPRG
jgi:PAS domain S-box-containing protein